MGNINNMIPTPDANINIIEAARGRVLDCDTNSGRVSGKEKSCKNTLAYDAYFAYSYVDNQIIFDTLFAFVTYNIVCYDGKIDQAESLAAIFGRRRLRFIPLSCSPAWEFR